MLVAYLFESKEVSAAVMSTRLAILWTCVLLSPILCFVLFTLALQELKFTYNAL